MRWTAINYLAVLAAGIASMLVGFAWYSRVLFGSAWAKCRGIDMHDPKQSQELQKGMGTEYAASFGATLLTAFALCLLVVRIQSGGTLAVLGTVLNSVIIGSGGGLLRIIRGTRGRDC